MPFTNSAPLIARLKRELPPTAPIPSALQTLGCRWWPFTYLERCRARYGSRFTVYPVDMPPLVFLSDPKDIRAMVAAPATVLHPGAGGTVIAPLIGERSFMLCDEDEHRYGRSAVMPAFHRKVVQGHATMAAAIIERCCNMATRHRLSAPSAPTCPDAKGSLEKHIRQRGLPARGAPETAARLALGYGQLPPPRATTASPAGMAIQMVAIHQGPCGSR